MKRRLIATPLMLLVLVGLLGCQMEERVIKQAWADFPQDPKPTPQQQARDRAGGQGWSILLTRFTGPGRAEEAQTLITQLRGSHLPGPLWVEDVDGTAIVFHGRYADPKTLPAQEALKRARDLTLNQAQPFASAQLIPLVGDGRRFADPLNLKQYVGFYTLQVAFYDDAFQGDRYAAAEEAVRVLRAEGHEAYYYHGPHRSMVTVGLFTQEEAFVTEASAYAVNSSVEAYSPRVLELKKQFPYNLGNGVTLIEKKDGKVLGEQPSSLVRVI